MKRLKLGKSRRQMRILEKRQQTDGSEEPPEQIRARRKNMASEETEEKRRLMNQIFPERGPEAAGHLRAQRMKHSTRRPIIKYYTNQT